MTFLIGTALVLGIILLLVLLERNTGGQNGGAGCVTVGFVGVIGVLVWWQMSSKSSAVSTQDSQVAAARGTTAPSEQFKRPTWMLGEWRGQGQSTAVFASFSPDGGWTMTFGKAGQVLETWGGTWWSVNGSDLRLVRTLQSLHGGAPRRTSDTKVVIGFDTTGTGIILRFNGAQVVLTKP